MNRSFSARPKPSNNNARIVFGITLGIAAIGFLFYFLMERYRGIVGTAALFVLVTALLIYTKFISPSFVYDVIDDGSDVPLFVVRQIIGRRVTTLCRIELSEIVSVKHETRAERRDHKTPRDYKKYVYAPTMSPAENYRLTVINRYERAEIVIEISDELAELLRETVKEARAMKASEDEE